MNGEALVIHPNDTALLATVLGRVVIAAKNGASVRFPLTKDELQAISRIHDRARLA